MMKSRTLPLAAAAALATMSFGTAAHAGSTEDILRGAVVGGAGGAALGAIIPGLSIGKGAVIGAGGGAVYGAIKKKNKRYYTDRSGHRYYVANNGRRYYE